MPSFDPTYVTTSYSLPVSQRGHFTLTGAYVDEGSGPVTWFGFNNAVFTFDIGGTLDAEGRLRAPSAPFTTPADLLGNAGNPFTFSVTVTGSPAPSNGPLNIFFGVDFDPAPEDFVVGDVDSNDFDDVLYFIRWMNNPDGAAPWVDNGDDTFTLTEAVDFDTQFTNVTFGDKVLTGNPKRTIHNLIRDPKWNGKLRVALGNFQLATFSITDISWTGQNLRPHTGRLGRDRHSRMRAVHDYKEGFPYWSKDAVPDGYREHKRVHPSTQDPPDWGDEAQRPVAEERMDDQTASIYREMDES